jgi:hypothetical protein
LIQLECITFYDEGRNVFLWMSLLARKIAVPPNGAERLVMRVSPSIAMAPAWVTVLTTVESDTENRALEVKFESADFYRSSTIQLDGQHAPRVNLFTFPNLPVGQYEVTAIVSASSGRRSAARSWVVVSGRSPR